MCNPRKDVTKMKLDNLKLAEIMVTAGYEEADATEISTELYEHEEKVMFRAILWAIAKFGMRATHNPDLIRQVMDNDRLNEFQAQAKIVHQEIYM